MGRKHSRSVSSGCKNKEAFFASVERDTCRENVHERLCSLPLPQCATSPRREAAYFRAEHVILIFFGSYTVLGAYEHVLLSRGEHSEQCGIRWERPERFYHRCEMLHHHPLI